MTYPQSGEIIEPENANSLSPSMVLSHADAYSVAFLPDGNRVILLGAAGLSAFDLSQAGSEFARAESLSIPMVVSQPSLMNIARDSAIVAWVDNDKSIDVWNFTDPEGARTLADFDVPVTGMALSPDGERITVSTYDNVLRTWESNFGESPKEWRAPSWLINLSYSPDKKYVGGADPGSFRVFIFDAENGKVQRTLEWLNSASPVLYGAYFSPDWKYIAWIARGSAQIMELESGKYGPLLNHEDFINAVAWSPDGRLLTVATAATVNGNMVPVVILWDALSGDQLSSLSQSAPIVSMAFSPDGKRLAILDDNGELQMLSIK
jgi:WD40 repeat protein